MTFLFFLLIGILLSRVITWAIFFRPRRTPTIDDVRKMAKDQEGKTIISQNPEATKRPKPKISDLSQDVDFEEI